jgi:hypothetical protein
MRSQSNADESYEGEVISDQVGKNRSELFGVISDQLVVSLITHL